MVLFSVSLEHWPCLATSTLHAETSLRNGDCFKPAAASDTGKEKTKETKNQRGNIIIKHYQQTRHILSVHGN